MQIEVIAVIGATSDGREFALAAAAGGYVTILEDITRSRLEEGLAYVHSRVSQPLTNRLRSARSVEDACREADLVIETTPEDMEVKIEIFTMLDKFAKPGAIFATTSFLPIHEMAAMTFRADKCIGMRFAGSGSDSKAIEIVRAERTSDDTASTCRAVAVRMGKQVKTIFEPSAAPPTGPITARVSTED